MKTILFYIRKISKLISVLMVLFLFSSDLSAQKTFKKFTIDDLNVLANLTLKNDPIIIFPIVINLDFINDVQFEDWQKVPFIPTVKSTDLIEMIPIDFVEEEFEIEDWMIEPDWNEIDADQKIESWMTSPETWISK